MCASPAYAITQTTLNWIDWSNTPTFAGEARHGLTRIGVGPGWKAIGRGLRTAGSLLTLAEAVGPDGVTVGLDVHARVCAAPLHSGRTWSAVVKLVRGDINALATDDACPSGPFDVAFCRNVLTHQKDARKRSPHRCHRAAGAISWRTPDGRPLPAPATGASGASIATPIGWFRQFQQRGSRW